MSVLQPISKFGSGRSGGHRTAGIYLITGIIIGGAGGFFIGQSTRPREIVRPVPVTQPAAPAVGANEANPQAGPPSVAGTSGNTASEHTPRAEDNFQRLDISVKGSLSSTLAREIKGHEADVLNAHLGRIMVWWFDLRRDVMRGDRAQILYQTAENPEDLRVLALRYVSAKQAKTLSAYYFKPRGVDYGRYYDPDGVEIELRLLHSPIETYEQITERMNLAGRRHHGVDFKADEGTQIVSPYRARIERRNFNTHRNGNCLQLLYIKSGIRAYFLHLSEILPIARPGRVVEAGTIIARSGNTGHSTAPHLHYELHGRENHLLDPFEAGKTEQRRLTGDILTEFKARRDRLDKALGDAAEVRESSAQPSGSNVSKATGE
ncbi:MAG TPA: M23 family metallopeptidase [Myxococcota bacterium]|nr:M23 family metallopeptidase [Myxococcota bacterium]